ncbi:hypothetical protein RvY_12147 [Ramazzottius varieornatus]|uniref:C-type lectin domain-containing protein n=1 Tax=Ramazzottius varieornatus TaxID=947166 RepID=A0A1D1VR56_RAMVA|nr:hypothetical protein RvY_12147 [Ramazzottius varieornatus]
MDHLRSNCISLFLLTLCAGTFALRCPSPEWTWRRETDSCYFFYGYGVHQDIDFDTLGPWAVRLNYSTVVEECKTRGGVLLPSVDQGELDWIYNKLSTRPAFYIGLTGESGRWEWKNTDTGEFSLFNPRDLKNFTTAAFPANPDTDGASRAAIKFNNQVKAFEAIEVKADAQLGYICKGDYHSRPRCRTEDGWAYRDGACYQYNPPNRTFTEATHSCLSSGGHIIVPDSADEEARMRRWMKDTVKTDKVWLGISIENKSKNTTVEDVKWADGQAWNGLHSPSQPWPYSDLNLYLTYLLNGRRYCGEAIQADGKYQWILDDKCETPRPFICESPFNLCPYGWVDFDKNCYAFLDADQQPSTREQAQRFCKNIKADLVSIPDPSTQKFLEAAIDRQTLNGGYWIGLKTDSSDMYALTWEDGSTSSYTNWRNTASSGCAYLGGKNTTETGRGKWGKSNCNSRMGAICKAPASAELEPYINQEPAGFECPPGYREIHDGCYKKIDGGSNRDDAQKRCEADKATLAYVKTHGENDVVQSLIGNTDSWLGLKIVGRDNHTATGFDAFEYEYSDGTPVNKDVAYMYFADVQTLDVDPDKFRLYCSVMAGPNSDFNINSHYGPNQTAVYTEPGRWYHRACSDVLQTAICYQPGVPKPPRPEEDNHGDNFDRECGPGWFRKGDYCYQVKKKPMEWHLAKQTCQNSDPAAELLYITSKEEEIFIRDYVQKNLSLWETDVSYWIDLASLDSGGWYWPYREIRQRQPWYIPFVVFNWADGHPRTFGQNERLSGYLEPVYGSTDAGGEWKSAQSATKRGYICKKPVDETLTSFNSTNGPDSFTVFPCAKGWSSLAGRCVLISTDKRTWQDANAECKRQGAELFSLRHKRDLNDSITFPSGSWIGLNSLDSPKRPIVFSWSDKNVPLTYTPWYIEPTSVVVANDTHDFNCGVITSQGFQMASCKEARPFICAAPPNGGHGGLSGGAIAGIVIGVLLALLLIGGIVFVFVTGRHKAFKASLQTSRINSTASRGLNNQAYDQAVGTGSARNTDRVAFQERFN